LGGLLFFHKPGRIDWAVIMNKKRNAALLVIDCQNYFLDPGSPSYLAESRAMVPRINRLVEAASSAGVPVVFTVHRAPGKPGNMMAERYERLPAGDECRLWKGIKRHKGSALVEKEHYSAFQATGLERRLKRLGIGEVLLCGVMTHLCVDTTARHGFMLGFRPTIVRDACCSKSRKYHQAAMLALKHGFADITTTSKVLKNGFGKGA